MNGKYKNYKSILLLLCICCSIYIVYKTINKYKDLKNKYPTYKANNNYDIYKDIPSDLDPMFASELVFANDPFNTDAEKGEEYAAILLSLIRKKYISLSRVNEVFDWNNNNTLITLLPTQIISDNTVTDSYEPNYKTINPETGMVLEPLTTSERLYLELIEKYARISNNSITIQQFQMMVDGDYENTKNFIKDIEKKPALENGVMLGYFQDTEFDANKKKLQSSARDSVVCGLLLLIIGNGVSIFTPMGLSFGAYTILGCALIWKYFFEKEKADEFILFTQYGADEQAKWKGLYNYLKSDEFKNDKSSIPLDKLEKYLIYATAFGISDNTINSINFHATDEELNNSLILNRRSYVRSHHFHSTSRSFGRSIHTTSRGGGFGGHGYGGGGRGGGGGGGGH